jgi:cytochrome c
MSRIIAVPGIFIISLVLSSSQFQARGPAGAPALRVQDAAAKQYVYEVNGKKVTVDFPVFVEGSDKKVTKDVFHGYQLYNSYCFRCHGTDATESALAPDLKRFVAVTTGKRFLAVALAGREDQGMPGWAGFLSEEEIQQIYQYVKGRSLELVPGGRPPSEYD